MSDLLWFSAGMWTTVVVYWAGQLWTAVGWPLIHPLFCSHLDGEWDTETQTGRCYNCDKTFREYPWPKRVPR